jgi:hypothetical protein
MTNGRRHLDGTSFSVGPMLVVILISWVVLMVLARRIHRPYQKETLDLMRRNTDAMERIAKALEK